VLKTGSKIINRLICKICGHLYPEKKLPTPEWLLKAFPEDYKDSRVGAFVADTSKPCARCGFKNVSGEGL